MSKWTEVILDRVINDFEKDPANFLRADRRRNNQKLANRYWDEMSASSWFSNEVLPKLPKEVVGNPFRFNQHADISPLSVQHLYHLFTMKMKSEFEVRNQAEVVIEFGGGFGNLCRLSYCLGFTGEYILVDFPQQLEIQKHFLIKSGVDMSRITFLTMEQLSEAVAILESKTSALVGTYSISEMPILDRQKIEPLYPLLNYIFIIYKAKDFDGVDNATYFSKMTDNLNAFETQYIIDQHYGKSTFLIAKRGL